MSRCVPSLAFSPQFHRHARLVSNCKRGKQYSVPAAFLWSSMLAGRLSQNSSALFSQATFLGRSMFCRLTL
jgi:hypothetical protein